MKYIFFTAFFCLSQAFALTPFSLENIKAVNVTVLHKGDVISEEQQEMIKKNLEKRLTVLGIQTQSQRFANLLLKINIMKLDNKSIGHVTLLLGEEALIHRETPTEGMVIGYQKDDLFEIDTLQSDLNDTIDYLFEEFADQYKEENTP